MTNQNRQVLLRRRPTGAPTTSISARPVRSGALKYREDIVDGLDNAPAAFIGLLQGRNLGKMLVKLGPNPAHRA
jgi:hypothetical protein